MIDTSNEAMIGDKAARELLAREKSMIVKHTPAPWHAHHDHGYLVVESENEEMYVLVKKQFGTDEDLANARLIAAAAELLEALQRLVLNANGDASTGYFDVPVTNITAAKAAIAKAEGKQA